MSELPSERPTKPTNDKPLPDIGDVLYEVANLSRDLTGGLEKLSSAMGNVERSVKSRLKHITDMALQIQQRQVQINEEQSRQSLEIQNLQRELGKLTARVAALESDRA